MTSPFRFSSDKLYDQKVIAYQYGFIHKTVSIIEHHYENVVKNIDKDF